MAYDPTQSEVPTQTEVDEKRAQLVSNLRDLISSADELLSSTASYTGAEIEAARSRLQSQLELVRMEANDYRHALKQSSRALAQAADECIHQHAWTAVGIAGVVGLLAGMCLSSGHSRR